MSSLLRHPTVNWVANRFSGRWCNESLAWRQESGWYRESLNALVPTWDEGFCFEWVGSKDFEKMVAEVFGSNEPAIALSCKFGFVPEGRQKNLFVLPGVGHVDNILMVLDIS